ncbi:MAG: hypothetical protein AAFX05_01300 [Planctomycetota bacterium]
MKRLLLSMNSSGCPFGCTYCFADFDQYSGVPTLTDLDTDPSLLDDVDVLYPACDTDLFAARHWKEHLASACQLGRVISVSTKAPLSERTIDFLEECHAALMEQGAFLKVSVSMSTRDRIPELEPRTASYEARLHVMAQLTERSVPTSLVLKPLLADVPDAEYELILSEARSHADLVLFGDEYLDSQSPRHIESNKRVGITVDRVEWLPRTPRWLQRSIDGRIARLIRYATSLGWRAYESDLSLLQTIRGTLTPSLATTMDAR